MYLMHPLAFEFGNGYRAPPWRQVHGDMAYIVIKTKESDPFTVAANISGYWAVKGAAHPGGDVNYERLGDVYTTLIALVKAKSTHFASTIDKQEFKDYSKPAAKVTLEKNAASPAPNAADDADPSQTAGAKKDKKDKKVTTQPAAKKQDPLAESLKYVHHDPFTTLSSV